MGENKLYNFVSKLLKSMKKIVLLVVIALSITGLQAQNEVKKWALGGGVSAMDFSGPITKQYFDLGEYRINQRYFVGRYLNPSFNLKLDFTFGKIWFPKVSAYPEVVPGIYENRHLYDAGLTVEYKFNNGYILKEKAIVAPYIFTGAGFNTIVDYGKANGTDINTYIPMGLGFNIRATNWLAFNLQSAYKLNLDNSYDYTQHTLSAVFNFGKSAPKGSLAKDIAEEEKDSDGDGVPDLIDECPFAPGTAEMFGCPDTDGDGIPDSRDECPNEKGSKLNKGCPDKDTDGDGVPDHKDACPNEKGEARYAGCPDSDGDGIVDKYDKCPHQKGVASNNGCPEEKIEKVEEIPTESTSIGSSTTTTTTTTYANQGVKVEDYVIYFASAKAAITNNQKDEVVKVAQILADNPSYKVRIKGYTDTAGDATSNMELSLKRATEVWQLLVDKGVSGDRADVYAYGESEQQPNINNRRVVMEIVK